MSILSRRELVVGGAVISALGAPAIVRARSAPNVVLLFVDDLNDWVSPLVGSYPGVRTPNFERLARLTRCYQQAYSPVPVCNGARTGILFGMHPYNSGVYDNLDDWTVAPALTERKSLPRVFKEAGYKTIGCGKIFHKGWMWDHPAKARDAGAWSDYQVCDSSEEGCQAPRSREYVEADNSFHLSSHDFTYGMTELTFQKMADGQRTRWFAREALGREHGRPFFGVLGINKPHMPLTVPRQFFGLYPKDTIRYPPGALDVEHATAETNADTRDLPEGGIALLRRGSLPSHWAITQGDKNRWKDIVRAYLAAVSFADHCLGVVLDGLERGPHADNTVIALVSDHGWQLGEKLGWRKTTLWERALRIPFFIGGSLAGRRIASGNESGAVSSLDVFPTLCDLALGEVPSAHALGGPPLDGRSLRAGLLGGKASGRPVISTWRVESADPRPSTYLNFTVRDDRYRLIQYGNGDRELYDHAVDRWEWNNLMAAPPNPNREAVCDRLASHLPDPSTCRQPAPRPDAPDDHA